MILLNLDTYVDLCLYIFSHFSFSKEIFKCQSLKRERAKKDLLQKLVLLGKCGAMYGAKAKCLFVKNI